MNIEYIRNIGCLQNLPAINLGRNMFIYGLNGAGKSTIKKIIKSSFIPDVKVIPFFGVTKTYANAKFTILNKNVEIKRGKVEKHIENIELHTFDDEYIENTVFENGIVKENNKINYYKILVGEGINLKVQRLNEKALLNQNLFKDIEFLISGLEKEFTYLNAIYSRFNDVDSILRMQLTPVEFTDEDLLKKVLKNVKDLGEIEVRWLNKGIEIRKSIAICPFCGQNVDDEINQKLINRYVELRVNYGNDEEVAYNILSEYISMIDEFVLNENLSYIDISNSEVTRDLELIRGYCVDKMEDLTKKKIIDKPVTFGEVSRKLIYIEKQINALKNVVNKLRIKDIFNIQIDTDAEEKYKNLRSSIRNLFVDDTKSLEILSKLSQIRKTAYGCNIKINEIAALQGNIIGNNIDFINEKFKEYDFGYTLCFSSVKHKVLTNSSDFLIDIYLKPIINPSRDIKFERKKIKETLSEGEKSLIAWVLFLCEIKQQLNQKRHFIILDDPISSYDSYRRFNLIYDLEEVFINNSIDKEILLLTHERSFTNSARLIKKMNFFQLINGIITNVNPDEIIENDMKTDIDFLRRNESLTNDISFVEFLVRSRNIIEYSKMKAAMLETKYFKENKYKEEYSNVSAVIHMRSCVLPQSYISYVEKEFYKIVRNNIKFDTSAIDLNNIDIISHLPTETSNPYINRVILDNYLQQKLISNGQTISHTATTGELLNKVYPFLSIEKIKQVKLILPLLNIFNHPNLNYGVRRLDIDSNKLELVKRVVKNITAS